MLPDRIATIDRQSGRLHAELPGSEFVAVPAVGHMMHHTVPDQVLSVVRSGSQQQTAAGLDAGAFGGLLYPSRCGSAKAAGRVVPPPNQTQFMAALFGSNSSLPFNCGSITPSYARVIRILRCDNAPTDCSK
jgi:hypothetical protein